MELGGRNKIKHLGTSLPDQREGRNDKVCLPFECGNFSHTRQATARSAAAMKCRWQRGQGKARATGLSWPKGWQKRAVWWEVAHYDSQGQPPARATTGQDRGGVPLVHPSWALWGMSDSVNGRNNHLFNGNNMETTGGFRDHLHNSMDRPAHKANMHSTLVSLLTIRIPPG